MAGLRAGVLKLDGTPARKPGPVPGTWHPSAEQIARTSAKTRGRKHPEDCSHCESIRGSRNPAWKNGSSQKEIRERLVAGAHFDPTITRRAVLDRDGWVCWVCDDVIPDILWENSLFQSQYGTIDHVRMVSEGGDHSWDNVRAAHLYCNSKRYYDAIREQR